MFPVPFSSIWNPAPWIQCARVHSVNSSDRTTSSLANQVLETTGPRVTTLKVPNSSIPFWTLFAKRPNPAIVSKAFNWHTHSVVVLDRVWVPCSSPKFVKNIQTVSVTRVALFSSLIDRLIRYHEHLQCCAITQSVGHSRWTLQRHPLSPSIGRKHRRNLLHWQRGAVRYLLPNIEIDDTNLRRSEPSRLGNDVGCYHLPSFPW